MDANFVNASIAAAGTFASAVDDVMTVYLDDYKSHVLVDPTYEKRFSYDYVDLKENVIGVLINMLGNGILIDICDAISAYLIDAGIDNSDAVHLKGRGRKDVLKCFANILLREGAIDEIFDGDYPQFCR